MASGVIHMGGVDFCSLPKQRQTPMEGSRLSGQNKALLSS